jgi:hypothetical protein
VVLLLLGAAGSVDEVLKFAAGFPMGKQKKTRQFAQVCCVSCARAAVETSKPAGRTRVVDSCAGETDDQPQGLQAVRKRWDREEGQEKRARALYLCRLIAHGGLSRSLTGCLVTLHRLWPVVLAKDY